MAYHSPLSVVCPDETLISTERTGNFIGIGAAEIRNFDPSVRVAGTQWVFGQLKIIHGPCTYTVCLEYYYHLRGHIVPETQKPKSQRPVYIPPG